MQGACQPLGFYHHFQFRDSIEENDRMIERANQMLAATTAEERVQGAFAKFGLKAQNTQTLSNRTNADAQAAAAMVHATRSPAERPGKKL